MVEVSRLVRRGRVKLGQEDFTDGWSAQMSLDASRYTVIQNVETTIRWGDESHSERFVEAWKSGKKPIVDSFMVTGWYRIGVKGSLSIKATAWAVPRHVSFASMGLTKGEVGQDPWGSTHGADGHLPIPGGVKVIRRLVEINWNNVEKKYTDEYDNGKDMKVRTKRKTYVQR